MLKIDKYVERTYDAGFRYMFLSYIYEEIETI